MISKEEALEIAKNGEIPEGYEDDKEVVITAVIQFGEAIYDASERLKEDDDVLRAELIGTVRINGDLEELSGVHFDYFFDNAFLEELLFAIRDCGKCFAKSLSDAKKFCETADNKLGEIIDEGLYYSRYSTRGSQKVYYKAPTQSQNESVIIPNFKNEKEAVAYYIDNYHFIVEDYDFVTESTVANSKDDDGLGNK